MWFSALLLSSTAREVHSTVLGEWPPLSAEEVGFTKGWGSISEHERLELRRRAGWKWEFPGESSEYRALQEKRLMEIFELDHYQERVDNFVQFTQSRSVRNFTRLGFDVVEVDAELTKRLRKRLEERMPTARKEGSRPLQGIYGEHIPKFVDHGERDLLAQLQPLLEEWVRESAPEGLLPVTAYGMRIYGRGSSLAWHTDRVDTHVISGIYHVSHDYDDPEQGWPIEIEGHDGHRHAVDLKPGQMLLYESAKCPHGRSKMFKGEHYASVFVHFKPRNRAKWPYTHNDIWLAVPPGWDRGIRVKHPDSPGDRWAGAFLTHDSMVVHGMPNRSSSSLADDYSGLTPDFPPPIVDDGILSPPRKVRQVPKAVEQRLTASKTASAPAPSKRGIRDKRRRLPRHDSSSSRGGESVELDDDEDDEDDEVSTTAAALGGGFLIAGAYFFGGFALLSTACLFFRRAFLTKGRSLVRYKHAKQDDDASSSFSSDEKNRRRVGTTSSTRRQMTSPPPSSSTQRLDP